MNARQAAKKYKRELKILRQKPTLVIKEDLNVIKVSAVSTINKHIAIPDSQIVDIMFYDIADKISKNLVEYIEFQTEEIGDNLITKGYLSIIKK